MANFTPDYDDDEFDNVKSKSQIKREMEALQQLGKKLLDLKPAQLKKVPIGEDLAHAIKIVNDTGYGLTSGIESLDEREVSYWKENLKAGNLYVNRGTTGAIVLRQPFGGMGKSAIGAGRKAGFYNYITQFVDITEKKNPVPKRTHMNDLTLFLKHCKVASMQKEDFEKLEIALQSYIENYENEFSKEKDYARVRGEDNHFRYLPLNSVVIRVCKDDCIFDIVARIMAARVSKVNFTVSVDDNDFLKVFLKNSPELFTSKDKLVTEDEKKFIQTIKNFDRVIYSDISKVSKDVFKESAKTLVFIVRQNAMMEGRLELLNYFSEQSISHSFHRYGNIGSRASE